MLFYFLPLRGPSSFSPEKRNSLGYCNICADQTKTKAINIWQDWHLGVLHLMAKEQAWSLARALRRTLICLTLNRVPRRHRKSCSAKSDVISGFNISKNGLTIQIYNFTTFQSAEKKINTDLESTTSLNGREFRFRFWPGWFSIINN